MARQKLKHLAEQNEQRHRVSAEYEERIKNLSEYQNQGGDTYENSKSSVYTISWRSRYPKESKIKSKKDLIIPNRFDFGGSAPTTYRNIAGLKKNKRKDFFDISGKNFD